HVAHEAAGFVNKVFDLHDDTQIRELLAQAGFHEVETRAYTKELPLPSARDFLWQYIRSTPLAGAVAAASEQSRNAMEKEVLAYWNEQERDDSLAYAQRIVMASARR